MSEIAYWNYRVVTEGPDTNGTTGYGIAEVYYDKTDRYVGWCFPRPGADSESDLRGDLELMMEAFDRPHIAREDLERMGREESDDRIRPETEPPTAHCDGHETWCHTCGSTVSFRTDA